MAVSAYSVIAVAEEPTMDVAGEPLAQGDTISVNGEEYTVADIGEQGEENETVGQLATTNGSAIYTAELANGSGLSPTNSSWPGKTAAFSTTVADGDTIQFNGSQQTANISDGSFGLVDAAGNETTTLSAGDTLAYEGNATTVTEIGSDSATLVWGENYEVVIENASDPDEFHVVQTFNVTQRLQQDPDVENQTFEGDEGRFVRYRNGTTQPLDEYLPDPDETTFTEGDTLTYRAADDLSAPANETTVMDVSGERVLLEWTGSRTTTQELTEGANVTLAGQQRVVHFADSSTVVLSPEVGAYQDQVARQDYYAERMNGLWGISILSGLAGVFVIGLAYLPTRG